MDTDRFNATDYLVDRHVRAGDGGRVAIRCDGRDVTYGELAELSAAVAAAFAALGVRREERVMLVMSDTVELVAAILGAMRAGMIAVPVNTMLGSTDLALPLADSRARMVVATSEFADAAAGALAVSDAVTHLVVVGDARPTVPDGVTLIGWADALAGVSVAAGAGADSTAGAGAAAAGQPVADTGDDSPALWLYTSGTTGRPKAAMHRHANIRHVCVTYAQQVLGIRPDDRCLSVAKLFFAYGIGNSLFFPLSVGATTILEPRRPTPAVVAERAAADRPTLFFGVPAFFAAMLRADLPHDTLAGVRLAASAGEALPAPLQLRWTGHFGVDILDGLGSTEALHIFVSNAPGDIGPGTSGRPVPGYDVEIRDDSGAVVVPGKPGTLFVRGESVATGYWCRTATSRAVFQGEWLATGDTYVQGHDGRYTCLGRSGDILKSGGIWVSPGEVEARLLEHPDVVESAVVAATDAHGLERPVAFVVLRDGATLVNAGAAGAQDVLVAFCRDGLAHFKAPRAVVVVDNLPRTATGKLQRFKVRELTTTLNPLSSPSEV